MRGRKNIQTARHFFGTGKNFIQPNPQMKQSSQLCQSSEGVPERRLTIQPSSGDSSVPQSTAPAASIAMYASIIISCPTRAFTLKMTASARSFCRCARLCSVSQVYDPFRMGLFALAQVCNDLVEIVVMLSRVGVTIAPDF